MIKTKKIKTLADNIIAAMPHKIKTNSYNTSNIIQHGILNNPTAITPDDAVIISDEKTNNNTNDSTFLVDSKNSQCGETLNGPEIMSITNSLNHNDSNEASFVMYKPMNFLRRNATSFDDGYNTICPLTSTSGRTNSVNNNYKNPGSCYSSSARSSLSPTSSLSFQFQQNSNGPVDTAALLNVSNFNQSRLLDDSPGEDSTCSSTFHIDSPPSTAEFCQYFHASSSSSYYKNAIETGFAQLTLTDDEQRELYEAALVIQNAYRRYIQRKKKKIRLDTNETIGSTNPTTNNTFNSLSSFVSSSNQLSLSRSLSTSISSINSNQSYQSSTKLISNPQQSPILIDSSLSSAEPNTSEINKDKNNLSDDDNNSSSSEDQKQFEAACIIQKYYRRYKQFENLHKYTEAAVKIQTRYRAYKSSSSSVASKSGFRGSSNHKYNKLRNYCHHNSIDETSIDNGSSLNEEGKRLNRSDLQLNNTNNNIGSSSFIHQNNSTQFSSHKFNNQKKIVRKLINHRQSPRFSPASPLSPSPAQSMTNTNSISNNNNITTYDLKASNASQQNSSLLHHHHHHYHHFHHHFHSSNNKNDIQQDHQQQINNLITDPTQPMFNRSHFVRKLSDVQSPLLNNNTQNSENNNILTDVNSLLSDTGNSGNNHKSNGGIYEQLPNKKQLSSTNNNGQLNAPSSDFDILNNFGHTCSNEDQFINTDLRLNTFDEFTNQNCINNNSNGMNTQIVTALPHERLV